VHVKVSATCRALFVAKGLGSLRTRWEERVQVHLKAAAVQLFSIFTARRFAANATPSASDCLKVTARAECQFQLRECLSWRRWLVLAALAVNLASVIYHFVVLLKEQGQCLASCFAAFPFGAYRAHCAQCVR
jgi:hypothetical protein